MLETKIYLYSEKPQAQKPTKFDIAFDYVIENEGGLNTDPADRGGITNFGISEKFIESLPDTDTLVYFRTVSDSGQESVTMPEITVVSIKSHIGISDYISLLDREQAKWIYQKYFWLPIYDQIENQDILNYIFDMTVQHGKQKSVELVQRAINAANKRRIVAVDWVFGAHTLSSINAICKEVFYTQNATPPRYAYEVGHAMLSVSLIAVRESLFRCIVAHEKTQEDKLDGWLKRCYR